MMNLLAGVFAGIGMLFGGLFGGHATTTPVSGDHGSMASTSAFRGGHMGSTTPYADGMMGSTTPGMGRGMPGVMGKVVSIDGTTLEVTGRSMSSATTTYSVDASSARILTFSGKGAASSTPATLSSISSGDNVMVIGTVTGTSIAATTIIEGMPKMGMMPMHAGAPGSRNRRMGSTTPQS